MMNGWNLTGPNVYLGILEYTGGLDCQRYMIPWKNVKRQRGCYRFLPAAPALCFLNTNGSFDYFEEYQDMLPPAAPVQSLRRTGGSFDYFREYQNMAIPMVRTDGSYPSCCGIVPHLRY